MTAKAQPDKSKGSILLIYPQDKQRQRYQALIEGAGYDVFICKDALEGLDTIYQTLPDLIVSNIMLSEMNGYQLCRVLKNDPVMQKIPFVLVSPLDEKIDKFWSFKAGADAFVREDEASDKLLSEISMLMEIYDRIDVQEKQQLLDNLAPTSPYNLRTRLNQILDKALIEANLMNEFRNFSNLIHDRNLLNYMLFSFMETLLDYDAAAIFYHDKTREPRVVTFNIADGNAYSAATLEKLKTDFFHALRENSAEPLRFDMSDYEVIGEIREGADPPIFKTVYQHPMLIDNELIGAVSFYSSKELNFEQIFPAALILEEIKLLMKLRHLYSQAEMLSVTDGLTGLFNYRQFTRILEREFRRAKRYGIDLSLAFIDIDQFQQFNELGSHALGDAILKHIAGLAIETFRGVDFIGRYSGDELAVLLPETSLENAQLACQRFQEKLKQAPLYWDNQTLSPTVTFGMVSLTDQIETTSEFINTAKGTMSQGAIVR